MSTTIYDNGLLKVMRFAGCHCARCGTRARARSTVQVTVGERYDVLCLTCFALIAAAAIACKPISEREDVDE